MKGHLLFYPNHHLHQRRGVERNYASEQALRRFRFKLRENCRCCPPKRLGAHSIVGTKLFQLRGRGALGEHSLGPSARPSHDRDSHEVDQLLGDVPDLIVCARANLEPLISLTGLACGVAGGFSGSSGDAQKVFGVRMGPGTSRGLQMGPGSPLGRFRKL